MAVYKRLSLAAGGGIVSARQQADQAENTATLLIGLGGTGTDCLRTIKTQVYTRLKPDDPEAITPTYSHIRFLGVDTDESQRGNGQNDEVAQNTGSKMSLDETEYFKISNSHVAEALSNELSIQKRPELAWLRYKDLNATQMGNAGAGGLRQVGRFMMMDKSNEFMTRVSQEIANAKRDLINPIMNIHIFAGVSGGTGAGAFLDVCYIVRSIADSVGGINVFGYFFLPDVNITSISSSNTHVQSYIPKNGYAALQELDYCMQLQHNGGAFIQTYKGGKQIAWDRPPVDMCHLVCATDAEHNSIKQPYDYAMNVAAEYVMDFLTNSSSTKFNLRSHLSNFQTVVAQADSIKTIGAEMSYIAIGASCALIPLREINTYLASELFAKFAQVAQNKPLVADVDRLAVRALAPGAEGIDGVYEELLRQVREGAEGDFAAFKHDWRFVAEQGNKKLVRNYSDQLADQVGDVVTNAEHMKSQHNEGSLLARVEGELRAAVRDLGRGPIYAYRMLDASVGYNLMNVVDGLIAQNNERWDHEKAQAELRKEDYENAKADFEAHQGSFMGMGCQSRFEAYEWYLRQLYLHRLELRAYEELDGVLSDLRKQLDNKGTGYYLKLARVTDNLIQTFDENRQALQSQKTVLDATGGFAEPMMSISELKPVLDAEVRRVDVPNMLDAFMATLLGKEDEWIAEDELRIAHMVNSFFVQTAFSNFAGRTITRFLADKYGATNAAQLTNIVYTNWIQRLTQKARPLFNFDAGVWDESLTSKIAFVSVPSASGPIKAAAQQMFTVDNLWEVKDSDLMDRIFVMCSAAALPLSSYGMCAEYESSYFSAVQPGMHYYEGTCDSKNPLSMPFNDWRRLPSLTPQSLIDESRVPHALRVSVEAARNLFEDAFTHGVVREDGQIMSVRTQDLESARETISKANELAKTITSKAQIPLAEDALSQLKSVAILELVETGAKVKTDGKTEPDVRRVILKDYFVSSPAFHEGIQNTLANIKSIKEEAATAEKALTEAKERIDSPDMDNFFDALFAGVIVIKGLQVSFERNEFGIKTEELLSTRDRQQYPDCDVPLYQAFTSYCALPSDDKRDMEERTSARFNEAYEEVVALGQVLKVEISNNKIQGWAQIARRKTNRNEIMQFLGELKQRFEDHCLSLGIQE